MSSNSFKKQKKGDARHKGPRSEEFYSLKTALTPEEAKEEVRNFLKFFLGEGPEAEAFLMNYFRKSWPNIPVNLAEPLTRTLIKRYFWMMRPAELVPLAKKSTLVYEAVWERISLLTFYKEPLSDEFNEFIEYSKNCHQKPKGQDTFLNKYRDHLFGFSVYLLQERRYWPITRKKYTERAISACDIVSQVYKELSGIKKGYSTIEDAWKKINSAIETNENIKQMMDLKIKFHPQNDLEKASNIAAFMFNHFITNQE